MNEGGGTVEVVGAGGGEMEINYLVEEKWRCKPPVSTCQSDLIFLQPLWPVKDWTILKLRCSSVHRKLDMPSKTDSGVST